GVHQDGLVHISQLADRFVKDPNEVVKVGQQVQVRVLSVDLQRQRIGLSMKADVPAKGAGKHVQLQKRESVQVKSSQPTTDLASALEKSGFRVKKRK
ncbi:MAG: S1 RNA-binding domain-containing protein, partial [Desulfuromonadales bacterium]|nr:S1 RNA-binding domain-containing protein [Desulfuromonadales bacterium]